MCTTAPPMVAARPGAPAAVAAYSPSPRQRQHPPASRLLRTPVVQTAPSSSSATATVATNVAAPLEVFREACYTKAVPPEEVLAAMKQVELAHKQHPMVEGFPDALTGTWRLVFSTPCPVKQWQYIPVLEDAVIDVEAGTIDLVSVVGPLNNAFKGKCSFVQDPATNTFVMHFGFTAAEARWFGRWDTKSEFAMKSRAYDFFLLAGDLAAANSSGGPKTLMYRVK